MAHDKEDFFPKPEEIEKEIEEKQEKQRKGPFLIILAIFLALLIIMMAVPYYSVKLNPEPRNIPTLSEAMTDTDYEYETLEYENPYDMPKFLEPTDPVVKGAADRIVTKSCESSGKICYAKALFYFV